jgi:hypothetical protein
VLTIDAVASNLQWHAPALCVSEFADDVLLPDFCTGSRSSIAGSAATAAAAAIAAAAAATVQDAVPAPHFRLLQRAALVSMLAMRRLNGRCIQGINMHLHVALGVGPLDL